MWQFFLEGKARRYLQFEPKLARLQLFLLSHLNHAARQKKSVLRAMEFLWVMKPALGVSL